MFLSPRCICGERGAASRDILKERSLAEPEVINKSIIVVSSSLIYWCNVLGSWLAENSSFSNQSEWRISGSREPIISSSIIEQPPQNKLSHAVKITFSPTTKYFYSSLFTMKIVDVEIRKIHNLYFIYLQSKWNMS